MNRVRVFIVLASLWFSATGCVVHTHPEYAHYHHHRHSEHREVIIVHRD
jgi:hypothetical protein